jgi:hypothetical protein
VDGWYCPGYKLDDVEFESRHGQEIFRFSKTTGLAPGPTQSPARVVPELSRGVKNPGFEVDHLTSSSVEVKIECRSTCVSFVALRGTNFAFYWISLTG